MTGVFLKVRNTFKAKCMFLRVLFIIITLSWSQLYLEETGGVSSCELSITNELIRNSDFIQIRLTRSTPNIFHVRSHDQHSYFDCKNIHSLCCSSYVFLKLILEEYDKHFRFILGVHGSLLWTLEGDRHFCSAQKRGSSITLQLRQTNQSFHLLEFDFEFHWSWPACFWNYAILS